MPPREERSEPESRLKRLRELQESGQDPFLIERFERTHSASEIHRCFAELEESEVQVAGRVTAVRVMGKALFLDLDDESARLQLYLKPDICGVDALAFVRDYVDPGDFVGVRGAVFRTRTGEVTLRVIRLTLLAKAMRPLPLGKRTKDGQTFYDLSDQELRHRQRYADLAVHPEVREAFRRRSAMVRGLRRYLDDAGFMEVETPMMQMVAGGATARRFETHHNALDLKLFLRISPELYLKRLIVGGFEKVYEINRNFRNEGVDSTHSPEFTMLEVYEAYTDLDGVMDRTEEMIITVVQQVMGGLEIVYQAQNINLAGPWRRLPMLSAIEELSGIRADQLVDFVEAQKLAEERGVDVSHDQNLGEVIAKLFEHFVEPTLIQPTFVTEFPIEISPLAKRLAGNRNLTRRFELFIGGKELGNAFSELNDPVDQRERLMAQGARHTSGDEEAHPMDEDFLLALEYGMPPTGGVGIGIDRLAMLLNDTGSIRDVILFPMLRPAGN